MNHFWSHFAVLCFFQLSCADHLPKACQNGYVEELTDKEGRRGYITSPGYEVNRSYPEGISCKWKIESLSGYHIRLTFEDVDLDMVKGCNGDSITVLEPGSTSVFGGSESKKIPIGKYCGHYKLQDIISSFDIIFIEFQSDYVSSGRGFNISYFMTASRKLCDFDEYECKSRTCIPKKYVCNGLDDCGDGSDEDHCGLDSFPLLDHNQCGLSPMKPLMSKSLKILGGTPAIKGSWPWQVSLQMKGIEPSGHFCGGVLIGPEFVLTAAHCLESFRDKRLLKLVFGLHHQFNDVKSHNSTVQVRYIKSYMIYPYIVDTVFTANDDLNFDLEHDIALLRLSWPLIVNNGTSVQSICLPNSEEEVPINKDCYSTGWGQTRGTGGSLILKQIRHQIKAQKECVLDKSLNESNRDTYANSSEICTSVEDTGHGLCVGDSGGPLVCQTKDEWFLYGIVGRTTEGSINGATCGLKGHKVYFTNVISKLNWIQSAMNKLKGL